ncbi:MAG: dTDP-4-dehydrorhamnose reductase [Anaerolineales bacterium]|nr:dTDP-4-dehydrorhamnose reductase [Anaerolineales bacterium]MCS7249102.1 dTDP-4-dehydrorhamnose reductase [Anaerolineales bacterium]MDW8162915.1 dTDP-4-dehydrorhamnose reductase [Anaerolineales bacterium]MDW8446091.1 dTDP-4-dehydrorhamnose reductase [Anaerolineales bacterium]
MGLRILLLGKNGQLGWELHRCLQPLGLVRAFDYPEIDLRDPASIRPLIREIKPEVLVNATAYTAVDRAESEDDLALQLNAEAPRVMAEECTLLNCLLIHYSTDYVFDGTKGSPYTEEDLPNPLNQYGRSKWIGEQGIQEVGGTYLIFRTAWVYSLRGESFVRKVLQWSRQQETLRVVEDQISNPTWARMLAEITALLLARYSLAELAERKGLYHLAGDGYCSRYEWARAILPLDPEPEGRLTRWLLPAKSTEFPTPARRPLFSALNCDRFVATFGLRLPPWQEALKLALDAL